MSRARNAIRWGAVSNAGLALLVLVAVLRSGHLQLWHLVLWQLVAVVWSLAAAWPPAGLWAPVRHDPPRDSEDRCRVRGCTCPGSGYDCRCDHLSPAWAAANELTCLIERAHLGHRWEPAGGFGGPVVDYWCPGNPVPERVTG